MRAWSPEIIVVSILVLVVLGVAGPAVLYQREHARQMLKKNRLQQIGLSLNNYHETFLSYPAEPAVPAINRKPDPKPAAPQPELISPL